MIGNFESPTFSNSHHHGAGFHGSPVEAKARNAERSCFFGRSSPCVASERISVGEIPRISTLCFAANSHILSGFGIIGRTVVNANRRAVNQRAVDQPRSHHPADVGQPRNARSFADIRAESHILRRFDRKTRVRVRDAFRLAGRAGCVKNYQRVFGESWFKLRISFRINQRAIIPLMRIQSVKFLFLDVISCNNLLATIYNKNFFNCRTV